MASRKTVGAAVAGLGLVLSSVLGSGAIAVARGADPTAPHHATPWAKHLDTMDESLRAGDVTAADNSQRAQLAAVTADRPDTIPADI